MSNIFSIDKISTHAKKYCSELKKLKKSIETDLIISESIADSLYEKLLNLEKSNKLKPKIITLGLNYSKNRDLSDLKNYSNQIKKNSKKFKKNILLYKKILAIDPTSIQLLQVNTHNVKLSLDAKNSIKLLQEELNIIANSSPQLYVSELNNSIKRLNSFFKSASTNPIIYNSKLFTDNHSARFYKNLLKIIGHKKKTWDQTNKKTTKDRMSELKKIHSSLLSLKNEINSLTSADRMTFIRSHKPCDAIYISLDPSIDKLSYALGNVEPKKISSNSDPYFNQVYEKSSQIRNNKSKNSFHVFIYRELYQHCRTVNLPIKTIDEILFTIFPDKGLSPKNLRTYVADLKKNNKNKTLTKKGSLKRK